MYRLACDNDSHWFIIPVDREDEWERWLDIPSDDERSWEPPAFAQPVGGSPTLVRFNDWRI